MNLHHLELFHTVAHAESFSKAAERLGISQPAVSVQIRKLEESLGLQLIQVVGRKLMLTPAGEELAVYADKLVAIATEAERRIRELRGLADGELRLGASNTPGTYLLPGMVGHYRSRYPSIHVTVTIENTQEVAKQLANFTLDVALLGGRPENAANLELEPLCWDELLVVLPPDHPLVAQPSISVADLLAQPLILREEGSSTRRVLESQLAAHGHAVPTHLVLSGTEAIKRAVAGKVGISVLSRFAVAWEVASGFLAARPLAGLDLRRRLHLAYPTAIKPSPAAQAFLTLARELGCPDAPGLTPGGTA